MKILYVWWVCEKMNVVVEKILKLGANHGEEGNNKSLSGGGNRP